MKILLHITADTLLGCCEALNLALALATFDHHVQLQLGNPILQLMQADPNGKLAKMLSSLDLYDMPPAWVNEEIYKALQADATLTTSMWYSQLQRMPLADLAFDATLIL